MVARVIWADMLSIAVTYFITLCLFPGLESEIRHCILGEWLPILLMAVFNLSDFVGKVGPAPAEGRAPPVEDARGSRWGVWEPSHGPDQGQEEGHLALAPGSLVEGSLVAQVWTHARGQEHPELASLSLGFSGGTQGSERESHLPAVAQRGGLRNPKPSLVSGFSCRCFLQVDTGGPDSLGRRVLVSQMGS